MIKIIYSFNKEGYEAKCWEREIAHASNEEFIFIPFNHGQYLSPELFADSVKLDRLYHSGNPQLLKLYADLNQIIYDHKADAIIVTNCPPYHPDFLKRIPLYKVLYSTDDPGSTYLTNIPYLHAYHHVLYASPSYSTEMNMDEKMRYCGMRNADWLPISVFDFEFDSDRDQEEVFPQKRDIDIVYIGGFWKQKINTLVKVRKVFGRKFKMFGFLRLKHNLYLNIRYGYKGWVSPVSYQERVHIYQRAKIGFNIHWNEYGLGNQRLYHLPANGVMQVCDCPDFLGQIFDVGNEIVGYKDDSELIEKLTYYLEHEDKRMQIARQGYRRTIRKYRFAIVTRHAGHLIRQGMDKIGWFCGLSY
jgi:hypothetical protein